MNGLINDWKPEVKSLLKTLVDFGFTPTSGNNGEDSFIFDGNLNKFIDNKDTLRRVETYAKLLEVAL